MTTTRKLLLLFFQGRLNHLHMISVGLLSFIIGCSPGNQTKNQINQWKTESRNLLKQQHLLFWYHGVQGMKIHLKESFENHQELLSLPTIQRVINAMNETRTPGETQELRFLKNFLMQKYLAMRIAMLNDSMRQIFQTAVITNQQQRFLFRDLPFRLVQTSDPVQRKQAYMAAQPVRQQLAQLLAQKYQQISRIVKQLGYPNYTEFIAEGYEIHPHDLLTLSDTLLKQTASEFRQLTQQLQQLYHLPDPIGEWDIPLLRSGKYFDAYVPTDQLLAQQHLFLRALGIDPKRQTGLTESLTSGPEKVYYRLMIPIDIPGDIRLSLKRQQHFEDFWQLFYLIGQAEHYIHTEISSWINQQLGSPTMRKVYGYLFASVWQNPAWLRHALPMSEKDSLFFSQYVRWYQLHQLRYYAVTFREGFSAFQQTNLSHDQWQTIAQHMVQNALPEFGWDVLNAEFDPYLTAALELEAMIIASQLEHYLKNNFGENWFENPGSSKFLKSLWWRGNEIPIHFVLKKINQPRLTSTFLLKPIESR